jgi:hypothetical protein
LAQVNEYMHPEWYFVEWMMVLGIPSTKWKIGTKQWWHI